MGAIIRADEDCCIVIAQLDRTMTEFARDPARVYLVGFSMGATGAYRIAYRWPNRFAAIVAIAGRIDTSDAQTYSEQEKERDRKANAFLTTADPFAALAQKISHIRSFSANAFSAAPTARTRVRGCSFSIGERQGVG